MRDGLSLSVFTARRSGHSAFGRQKGIRGFSMCESRGCLFLLSVCFSCRPEATPGATEPLRKPTVLFKEIKLYLLDKDGTIYLDNTLFDGTVDFLAYVRHIGGRYIFLTNNSSKSADKYIGKLKNMGIEATENDFLTSTDATAEHLKKADTKKFIPLGQRPFRNSLLRAACISQMKWRKISTAFAWANMIRSLPIRSWRTPASF